MLEEQIKKIYLKGFLKKAKPFLFVFLFLIFGFLSFNFYFENFANSATAPAIITYQGKLLENGVSVTTTKQMYFRIYDNSAGGSLLYTASGTLVANLPVEVTPNDGVFSINLGSGGVISNVIDQTIFRDNAGLYLEVTVGGDILTPRKRITSVAYAINSNYLMGLSPLVSSTSQYVPISESNGSFLFAGDPAGSGVGQGAIYVNPLNAGADETLIGVADNGTARFKVDKEGDAYIGGTLEVTATSTLVTTTIYGNLLVTATSTLATTTITNLNVNNGTLLANAGKVGIGTTTPSEKLQLEKGNFLHTGGGITEVGTIVDGIGATRLGGAGSVYVSGKYAYVTSEVDDSLSIIDISDPVNPTEVGTIVDSIGATRLNGANSVYVSGKYAYVASNIDNSLSIIDISNPTNPTEIGVIVDGIDATVLDYANSVYVSGKYAYVTSYTGKALSIIDISDPSNPVETGTIVDGAGATRLEGANSVYVSGKYAYVTSFDDNALSIIDISNPYSPTEISSLVDGINATDLEGANSVYISGKYAYVTSWVDNSLSIFDISNPSVPLESGTIVSGLGATKLSSPKSVYVSGKYAYVASTADNSLSVIDISNASNPFEVGVIVDGVGATRLFGAYGVYISGKYAYVASNVDSSLSILSISGVDTPTANIGNIFSSNINISENLDVANNLYVRSGLNVGGGGIKLDGDLSMSNISTNTLSFSSTTLFKTFVSAFAHEAFMFDTINTLTNGNLMTVRNNGSTKFVIDESGNVGINSTTPNYALSVNGTTYLGGTLEVTATSTLVTTTIYGNLLVTATSTLATTTITNLNVNNGTLLANAGKVGIGTTTPSEKLQLEKGNFLHTGGGISEVGTIVDGVGATRLSGATSVYVSGKYAYVASNVDDSLSIIDISDPTNPTEVGTIVDSIGATRLSGANSVYVSGKYAYVASYVDDSLSIIDISDPTNPTEVGTIVDSIGATRLDAAYSVYVSGKYAYVASMWDHSLSIIDISDPTNPTEVGTIVDSIGATRLSGADSVYVSGKYAYVAAQFDNSLSIINISSSTKPTEVGTIVHGIGATRLNGADSVYVSGKYAYVTSYNSISLSVFDISSSTNLVEVGTIVDGVGATRLEGAWSVFVSGKYVYVASNVDNSLSILSISGVDTPTANIGSLFSSNIGISENLDVGNSMSIRNGLNVGMGGILSNGEVGIVSSNTPFFARTTGSSTVAIFDRYFNNGGILLSLRRSGIEQGAISENAGTISYNAFTGSHYTWTNEQINRNELVSLTGQNKYLHNDISSEILYGIKKTTQTNDKNAFGSYIGLQESGKDAGVENPNLVAAVGNGDLLVVDNGENIQIGDNLISASVAGHAMKDIGEFSISYVVAKAAEPVDWSQVEEKVGGVKYKKISVFFASQTVDNNYRAVTVDLNNKNLIIGTSTNQFNLNLNGDLNLFSEVANKIEFNKGALFVSNKEEIIGESTFIIDAKNYSTNNTDSYLLSLRSNGQPIFSVSGNGDVRSVGDMYAKTFVAGMPGEPGDLAERVDIIPGENIEPGDVLVVDKEKIDTYRKSNEENEQTVAGVASEKPSIVIGNGKTDYTALMTLVGRVPVKVTASNGSIQKGDLLVTSGLAGYAMKYDENKETGKKAIGVVGIALENLENGEGKIMSLVKAGWVNNREQTLNELRNDLVFLADYSGIDLKNKELPEKLTVEENNDNKIVFVPTEDLNMNGYYLLNIGGLVGKNNKWQIDKDGLFITKINTNEGEKSFYAVQSENLEYIFSGSDILENGEKEIKFLEINKKLIDPEKQIKVSITLTGEAQGVYVTEKSFEGFKVKELGNGQSNATFDWMVIAVRRNIDNLDLGEQVEQNENKINEEEIIVDNSISTTTEQLQITTSTDEQINNDPVLPIIPEENNLEVIEDQPIIELPTVEPEPIAEPIIEVPNNDIPSVEDNPVLPPNEGI